VQKIEVILRYDSEHEAQEAMAAYVLAQGAQRVLSDLRDWLRADTKYGEAKYEVVYEKLFELAKERGLDLWEV